MTDPYGMSPTPRSLIPKTLAEPATDAGHPHEASHRFYETCSDANPHVYESQHEPDHCVYWVRVCIICHRVDWDDLDREIAEFIKLTEPKKTDLTNPEEPDTL